MPRLCASRRKPRVNGSGCSPMRVTFIRQRAHQSMAGTASSTVRKFSRGSSPRVKRTARSGRSYRSVGHVHTEPSGLQISESSHAQAPYQTPTSVPAVTTMRKGGDRTITRYPSGAAMASRASARSSPGQRFNDRASAARPSTMIASLSASPARGSPGSARQVVSIPYRTRSSAAMRSAA